MSSSLPISKPAPRVDDNTGLSLGICFGVALLVHVAFFSGLGAAAHYHLFDRFGDSDHGSADTKKDESSKSESKKEEQSKPEKTATNDEDRRHLLAALMPPKEPELRFGKEGSNSESASWISYDDYQKLIAPKSSVEQPALQSQVDPLPGAPLRPDPTPPKAESSKASSLQSRAVASAHKATPGELTPPVIPGAVAGKKSTEQNAEHPVPAKVAVAPAKPEAPRLASTVLPPGSAPIAPGTSTQTPRSALQPVEQTGKPVPDQHLPEGPTLRRTVSSPAVGQGHDLTIARQQPGVDMLPSSPEPGQVASAAPAPTVVQGPVSGTQKGQPNPKPPKPDAVPTESPTAPKAIPAPAVAAKVPDPTPVTAERPASSVPPPTPAMPDPNPPAESRVVAMANPAPTPQMPQVNHDPGHEATPATPTHAGSTSANPGEPAPPPAVGPNPGQLNSRPGTNDESARPTGSPRSPSDAAPVSLNDTPLPTRAGEVISGNGIEIQTTFPQYSVVARYSSIPVNPEILVTFNQDGVVTDARIVKTSTYDNIDDPILASLYKWRASGSMLRKLNRPFTVKIKMLIVNE